MEERNGAAVRRAANEALRLQLAIFRSRRCRNPTPPLALRLPG
jgi:hypothetical protein